MSHCVPLSPDGGEKAKLSLNYTFLCTEKAQHSMTCPKVIFRGVLYDSIYLMRAVFTVSRSDCWFAQ